MWRRMLTGGLLMLLALVTVGCSDNEDAGASQGEVERITVEMAELKFDPMRLSVSTGQPVEVTVKNVGTTDHDFVITGLPAKDVKSVTAGHGGHGGREEIVGHAKPKQTVTVRFTPLRTGDFDIVCSLPGHKEGGMTGVLTVA
jgi:uncharacterized cupredoxin-like copper-binding protein